MAQRGDCSSVFDLGFLRPVTTLVLIIQICGMVMMMQNKLTIHSITLCVPFIH